jgi:thioesterase domain-containing protein
MTYSPVRWRIEFLWNFSSGDLRSSLIAARDAILPKQQPAPPHLTILRPQGEAGSFWCLPGSDGDAGIFGNLAPHLPPEYAAYGINLRHVHAEEAQLSIEGIAAACVLAVQSRDHPGPIHLLGYSFGGLVAYEMARQLKVLGYSVGFLGMVDTSLMVQLASITSEEAVSAKIRRKFTTWARHGRTLITGPQRARWFRETVISKFFAKAYASLTVRDWAIPNWLRNVNDLNIFASTRYRPPPSTDRVVLIRARDEFRDSRWTIDLGWRSVQIGELQIWELPGTHRDLVRTESVSLGLVVCDCLIGRQPARNSEGPARGV